MSGAGTNSITVDFGNSYTPGYVAVSASNTCMTSAERRIFVDYKPAQPGAIAGSQVVCPGTTGYSIAAVPNAVSYVWTLPAGVTIQSGSGTNSITALFPNTWQSGNVTVMAVSGCTPSTNSVIRSKNLTSPIPQVPVSVTGPAANLCGQTVAYTSTTVSGASSYQWTVPAGATLNSGQGTTSISVTYPSSGVTVSEVCVNAVTNSCSAPNNTRGPRCLYVRAIPSPLGTITGPTSVCPGNTYSYNVANTPGITYSWTVPSGSSITNGAGTNAIDVLLGNNVGYMNVTGFNSCGGSNTSVLLLNLGSCRIAAGSTVAADDNVFAAYPNPTTDKVTLAFSSDKDNVYSLQLFDLSGRELKKMHGQVLEGLNFIELSLAEQPAGIYIAVLKNGDMSRQVRIVRQ